jgi:3-isopropylmalate dehydrogenase
MHIAVMPGDGIGPEITSVTVAVLHLLNDRLGLGLTFDEHEIGLASLRRVGTTLPDDAMEAARRADGILLGPVSHHEYPARAQGGVNVSAACRIAFDLYANIRPSRSRRGLPHWGRTPMDLVIVRENTEGFYADRSMFAGTGEFMPDEDMALAIRKITARASRRSAACAFEQARARRRRVTAVHKGNVLKLSEALFLREVRSVAAMYPDVAYDEQIVDAVAALLVRDAARYDVIVTTNMFGDILSDEAAELSGSLGLAGSINVGDEHGMAQAQHGSAPDIAGRNRANPASLLLSAAMLLEWLSNRHSLPGLADAAGIIERGIDALVADPATRTPDLGGTLGTREFSEALCDSIRAGRHDPRDRRAP